MLLLSLHLYRSSLVLENHQVVFIEDDHYDPEMLKMADAELGFGNSLAFFGNLRKSPNIPGNHYRASFAHLIRFESFCMNILEEQAFQFSTQ